MHRFNESYRNPRKRVPRRLPADPGRIQRERELALVEARNELDMAKRAAERGNDNAAAMILRTVRAKLDFAEGKTVTPNRRMSQRPSRDVLTTEIAALNRRSNLLKYRGEG